jgi:serine-type anaerobic sulfatase-maturating enzyme
MRRLSLIVKATRLCNLRCTYCHDWRTGAGHTMPFDVLARMIAAALRDPEHDVVDFIWHGGETTALPISFYERALIVQSRFRREGQIVRNLIQTNGTLVDAEWARFLRANEFVVGVSLDGPQAVHDRQRVFASGEGSFARVLHGINLLREHGVRFGVLLVADEDVLALGPDAVFDFFQELDVRDWSVLTVKPENDPGASAGSAVPHYADPATMARFLSRLYDRWAEEGDRMIRIRELNAIRRGLAGRRPGMCTVAGGCFGHYYLVEPNGDVAHCDLFLGDPTYTLGNVLRDSFAEIRAGERLAAVTTANRQAVDRMRACPEFAVCKGWCPHERYLSRRHNHAHSDDCCGLRPLISHIRTRMEAAGELGPLRVDGRGRTVIRDADPDPLAVPVQRDRHPAAHPRILEPVVDQVADHLT